MYTDLSMLCIPIGYECMITQAGLSLFYCFDELKAATEMIMIVIVIISQV